MSFITVFFDDIIIKVQTVEECIINTEETLGKLRKCGLKFKKSKCQLLGKRINYLGLEIDEFGVHTSENKIEAINKVPTPQKLKELQAFLGMINYYDRFIENRATKFQPLYNCLNKNKFEWKRAGKRLREPKEN